MFFAWVPTSAPRRAAHEGREKVRQAKAVADQFERLDLDLFSFIEYRRRDMDGMETIRDQSTVAHILQNPKKEYVG